MFRSLLVPLDGSPDSEAALSVARAVAHATGGKITLLRVPCHAPSDCEQADTYLKHAVQQLRGDGLAVDAIVRPGQPTREILAVARELKSDLVVMATHEGGPRSITILTSVARWVVASCPAPVILVRPATRPTGQLRTLLVPLDGSPGASMALGPAADLARAAGSRIALVEVVVPVPGSAYAGPSGMSLGGSIDPSWEQAALDTAHSYVNAMAQHLRDRGLSADSHVAVGDVATEINHHAEAIDADLVLMSTHTLRWPADANVSSVAESVLRLGNRPVLLVRREPPAGESEATFAAIGAAWPGP